MHIGRSFFLPTFQIQYKIRMISMAIFPGFKYIFETGHKAISSYSEAISCRGRKTETLGPMCIFYEDARYIRYLPVAPARAAIA